jgi:hypothetical protein
MFDKCIRNEMEEDMRKELTKIREECMELRQDIHNINTRIRIKNKSTNPVISHECRKSRKVEHIRGHL